MKKILRIVAMFIITIAIVLLVYGTIIEGRLYIKEYMHLKKPLPVIILSIGSILLIISIFLKSNLPPRNKQFHQGP